MPTAPLLTSTEGNTRRSLSMELVRYDRFCLVKIAEDGVRYPATIQLTRSQANVAGNALLDFAAAMPVEREV